MNEGTKAFDKVVDCLKENTYYVEYLSQELNIIQQELEKVENKDKLVKALKIIIKKNVDVFFLKVSDDVKEYNFLLKKEECLTKREYKLLREVIDNEQNN